MPVWWPWLLAAGMMAALAATAAAQDNPPSPPGTIAPPGSQAANPKSPGAATPDSPGTSTASSDGVIRPPVAVDPGIAAKPPASPDAMATPVIPPPGSKGGDQSVQPK